MRALLVFPIFLFACAQMAFAQDQYRLQPGDTLELWVAQEQQLNRSVTIGPDGRLSLPFAGQIVAGGLTTDELTAALKERLQTFYSEALNITVMLQPNELHVRSIFVAGDVAQPGVFPFRPDITVMHAISMAGGLYRAEFLVADQDRFTMLSGDVARTQNRVDQLGVLIARLEAELAGAAEIDRKNAELAEIAPERLTSILAQEQALLDMRNNELRIKEAEETQLKAASVRLLDAAKEQLRSIETRIGLANQRLESANKLIAQGFSQGSQRLELESAIAALESDRSEIMAELATQEAAVINHDSGMEAFRQARKTELLTTINSNRREREALVSTLKDSITALQAYDDATAGEANSVITYTVLRTKNGKTEEIPASELTPVEPGDLIRVSKLRPNTSASTADN